MKVQCEVETDVWRAARVFSLENGETIGEVVTNALKDFLQDRTGPVINRRERSSVASALVKRQANPAALDETNKGRTPGDTVQRTGAAIKGGSTPSTPATPARAKGGLVMGGGAAEGHCYSEPKKELTPEEVEANQRSCKHAFVAGARACVKCGWVPPIMG